MSAEAPNPPPMSLRDVFRQPTLRPTNVAFLVDGVSWTYRQLGYRVNGLRAAIDREVAEPGSIVAVVDRADFDTYAAVLAVLCAGHAYVPLNPGHPIERSGSVLEQTGCKVVLDSRPAAIEEGGGEGLPGVTTIHSGNCADADTPDLVPVDAPADALAYLIFTSGSTGKPKGVPISRGNLDAFLQGFFALVDMGPSDRVLQMFDLTFDFSVMSLFAPLVAGACVCPVSPGEHRFKSVYRLLEENQITCAPMVPSVLTFLRPYFSDIQLPSLRSSVFCGEALLSDLTREWSSCAPAMRIFNFYGPTEATVFCSCYEWGLARSKQVNGALSIGRAMLHAGMFVLGESGQLAGPGEHGELCITGRQLTTGYWQDPIKSAAAFFDITFNGHAERAYRTGDSAFVDPDGDFMYLGRLDNQVKVQGFRIELGEVEHHARESASGVDLAAVNVAGPNGVTEIVLCLGGADIDPRELLVAMRKRMPSYMVPSRVVCLDSLPLNSSGKVDRPTLRRLVSTSQPPK